MNKNILINFIINKFIIKELKIYVRYFLLMRIIDFINISVIIIINNSKKLSFNKYNFFFFGSKNNVRIKL